MKKNGLIAAGVIALAAGAASASSISIGGSAGLTGAFGSGAVAVGGSYQQPFSSSFGGSSVTGTVQASNFGNSLFLTLTDLDYTTTSLTPITLTVHIIQDYVLSPLAVSATASHQINGNITGTFGGARIQQSPDLHESTLLAALDTGVLTTPGAFNAGSGAAIPVGLIGSVYTIDTTYTLTLFRGTGPSATILLPNSGVDQVSIVVAPLPPATYAGLGTLAMLGAGVAIRRRRHNRA